MVTNFLEVANGEEEGVHHYQVANGEEEGVHHYQVANGEEEGAHHYLHSRYLAMHTII